MHQIKEVNGDVTGQENTNFRVHGPGLEPWYFVPTSFNWFRPEVERETKWRYSVGCDMILLNSRSCKNGSVDLDFSSAIALRLHKIQDFVATPNISMLFEAIFQYSEKQDSNDPVWGLSDALGLKTVKASLWGIVLSIIPKALRPALNAARHLVVQDISVAV